MNYLGQNLVGNINPRMWASGVTFAKYETVLSPLDGEIYRRVAATGSGTIDPADDITNYFAVSYERTVSLPEPTVFNISHAGTGDNSIAPGSIKDVFGPAGPNQRIKMVDITGRGLLVFAGLMQTGTAGSRTWRMEIVVDGRVICDRTVPSNNTNRNVIAFCGKMEGFGYGDQAFYAGSVGPHGRGVEVKRSLEIWVSCSVEHMTNQDLFMYTFIRKEAALYYTPPSVTPFPLANPSGSISFLNNNDLDFVYSGPPTAAITPEQHVEFICTVDASNFFANGADHMVFVLDTESEQGFNNPHCGPIIRNGQNMWGYARGVVVTGTGVINAERWNGTFSPVIGAFTKTAGAGWTATTAKTTWTIRINAGYRTSAQYSTRMRVRIYAGTSTAGALWYDGQTAEAGAWQCPRALPERKFAIAGIGMGFVKPSDTGCVEEKVSRANAAAVLQYSNWSLNNYL